MEKVKDIIHGAFYGNLSLVKESLKNGDDIESEFKGNSVLGWAVQEGHIEVVKFLLDKGANIEFKDKTEGFSILDYAMNDHTGKVLELLISYGVNVNGKSSNGSVLHTATSFEMIEVVKILLKNGIDTSIKDSDGKTALDFAKETENQELISLFDNFS